MKHQIRNMSDTEPVLRVDPSAIECGYLLYPRPFDAVIKSGELNPHQALETNQPRFWPDVRRHDPKILVHLVMASSKVEIAILKPALSKVGVFDGHSVTVGLMKFSLDGGSTMQEVFVGFCWKSAQPEMIVLRPDGVMAKKAGPFWKFW